MERWVFLLISISLLFPSFTKSQTDVSGDINSNTTWSTAGSPYVINGVVRVLDGVTLTINPGVVVKFVSQDLEVYGTLISEGTSSNPITFTAHTDDRFGGDTNNDGSSTSPGPGSWDAIWLYQGSTASFIHTSIYYGARSFTSAMVNVYTSDVNFENCEISFASQRGVYVENASPGFTSCTFNNNASEGIHFAGFDEVKGINLTNNTFVNNTWAVLANLEEDKVDIFLSGNSSSGQNNGGVGRNGFGLFGSVSGNIILDGQDDFPFIIASTFSGLKILANSSVSVTPGTVFKFEQQDLEVYGNLIAIGTSSQPIIFTDLSDDQYGGDTNGDGTASQPVPGLWDAIWFYGESSATLTHCKFLYGARSFTSSMINIYSSNIDFNNCEISYASQRGIYAENASPSFTSCTFTSNASAAVHFTGFGSQKVISFTDNTFSDNTWAVLAELESDSVDVILTGNTSSGQNPSMVGRNGFGLYGSISGNITLDGQDDFPFIIASTYSGLDILTGGNVTVTPGTIFKFEQQDLDVYGNLIAEGTASNPIIFTDLSDDQYGGDTNGDGGATQPTPGSWDVMVFHPESSASLKQCKMLYGARSFTSSMVSVYSSNVNFENCEISSASQRGVYVENASPTFISCTFNNNASDGIFYEGFGSQKDIVLTDNTFSNNTWAVLAAMSSDSVNVFLTGNTSSGHNAEMVGRNGFGIYGTLSGNILLDGQDDFPFIIATASSGLQVNPNSDVTITPGTVIKFDQQDFQVYGNLVAEGTETEPIIFTDLSDDEYGGDTNGDGTATQPAPGLWDALWFYHESTSSLKHCKFLYGARSFTSAMINVYSSNVNFDNCEISFASQRGVYSEIASPSFTSCTFNNNATEAIHYFRFGSNKSIELTDNAFSNNTWAVIADLNADSVDIILTGNVSSGQNPSMVGRNGFGIYGSVSGDILLDGQNDFPFIIATSASGLTAIANSNVVITPGTVIKFDQQDLQIFGNFSAEGTETEPIIFTDITDDQYGGDTNGDGDASQPVRGSWDAIWFYGESHASLKHCKFLYGARSFTPSMINVYSNNVNFESCEISNSSQRGVSVENASPTFTSCTMNNNNEAIFFNGFGSGKSIQLTDNSFSNNTWAILAGLSSDSVDVILTGNTSSGHNNDGYGRNGFGIYGSVTGNITLDGQSDFPFIIATASSGLDILAEGNVTVTPGTVFKIEQQDLEVYGNLIAEGTESQPIIFTDLADDLRGGDANGDGDATHPVPGSWDAIWFYMGSSASFKNVCITYGARSFTSAMINVFSDDLSFENCAIGQSSQRAFYLENASPSFMKTVIHDNDIGIFAAGNSLPTVNQCDILNNRSWGIFNSNSSTALDATENFWGSSLGPKNETANPDGKGNPVNDAVDFSDWLTELSDQTLIPKPALEYTNAGQRFSFDNTSPFESSFLWTFGDGDSSILSSPFHRFDIPGRYDVCITGVTRCATTMTQCGLVEVAGITSILPDRGGNTGEVTITVIGVGFTIDSYFKLVRNGVELTADEYVLSSSGSLIGTIDLTGADLGSYDLCVVIPGVDTFTKTGAFKVEEGTIAQPWVTITGRPTVLLGSPTKFTVDYGNMGNTDAKSIPITIAISDLPDLEIDFPEIVIDFPPYVDPNDPDIPQITSDPCYFIVQSVQGIEQQMRVYTFHIPIIAALSVNSIDVTVSSRESYNFLAWTGTSFYPGGFDEHYVACFVEIIRELGYSETVIDLITVDRIITHVEYIFNYYYEEYGIVGCWDWYWIWAIQQVVEGQLTYTEVVDIVQRFTAVYVDAYAYEEINIECIEIIIPHDVENWPVRVVTSFDPNEKVGIIGETENNFIGERDNLTYTIFFENKASADIPAHTIIVRDTLDLNAFDLSEFAFEDIYIGEYKMVPDEGARSFVGELYVQDSTVVARIEAKLDSINGILEWRFRSFYPDTGEEVDDPFVGILPPNMTSPEGEGSVTFTVGLNQPIKDGDEILNKAIIYFDFNEPIITNTYVNVFDLNPPESMVDAVARTNKDTVQLDIISSDNSSGIELYQVWVARGSEGFKLWKVTDETVLDYVAAGDDTYSFYSVAYDKAGNIELAPDVADVTTEVATSTEEIEQAIEEWMIVPNPTDGVVNISGHIPESAYVKISLLNMLGQRISMIYEGELHAGIHKLTTDLSLHSKGVYFIEFNLGNAVLSKRIIKN